MKNKTKIINLLRHLSLFLGFFILFVGPLFLAYLNVRIEYKAKRNYSEYVSYSAQLTDYIFPAHLNSALGRTKIMKKWSSFGYRAGIFPGFVILSIALMGIFKIILINKEDKKLKLLAIDLNKFSIFFLSLITIGFIFSLGPRLSANGKYLNIPLPYHLIIKFNPLFEAIRVPYRWSLLMFIGLVYFAILGTRKLKRNQDILIIVLSFLFILELIPLKLTTEEEKYFPEVYQVIVEDCENKVLLEYPMTQFKKDANIVTNLTYRTQAMLTSVHHGCSLINGYTGYIPQEYTAYENRLFQSMEKDDAKLFTELLQEKNIDFFKLNKKEIFSDRAQKIEVWLTKNPKFTTLYNNKNYLIMELK